MQPGRDTTLPLSTVVSRPPLLPPLPLRTEAVHGPFNHRRLGIEAAPAPSACLASAPATLLSFSPKPKP